MKLKRNRLAIATVSAAAISIGSAGPVGAQEVMEEVISIGSFQPIEAEKLGTAFTTIDQETIEATGMVYVPDVLRQVPGLAVSRTGPGGGLTQIRVRGSEGNHVLVFVDGVEINGVNNGEVDFSSLMSDNVERIEVLRGPQSGLYGSNATAGVINIITKSGAVDPGVDVALEAGSLENSRASVRVYGGTGNVNGSLGVVSQETSFNASPIGSEDDDDSNLTITGKGSWQVSDILRLDATLRTVDKDSDVDDQDFSGGPNQGLVLDSDSFVNTEELNYSLGALISLRDDAWQTRVTWSTLDTEQEGASGFGPYGSEAQRDKLALNSTLNFAETANLVHSGTVFIEREEESYRNTFPADPSQAPEQERSLLGIGLQYHAEFNESFFLTLAGRSDDNDNFDDATTYSANFSWLATNSTRLHASVGKGVTNPTFFEQFGFTPGRFIGNPDLQPETSEGWDFGIEQQFLDGDLVVDLTWFDADLQNEIFTQFLPGFIGTPANNTADSERDGWELVVDWNPSDNFSLSGTWTNTDAVEPVGVEVRRPEDMGSLSATWRFSNGRGQVAVNGIYNGDMLDTDFRTFQRETLDSYFLTNVSASYQFTDSIQGYVNLNNITDEDYQEVWNYATPGSWGAVGVRMSF